MIILENADRRISIDEKALQQLDGTFTLMEGLFGASRQTEEWRQENAIPPAEEPAWLANCEIAFFYFRAMKDDLSCLRLLHRVAPTVGDFIDETRDLEVEKRAPIIARFVSMCDTLYPFELLWEATNHPLHSIIQTHRRCMTLFR